MNLKSLYVTSVERYSGKTATCLALGRRFQSDGYRVGYLKPVSLRQGYVVGLPTPLVADTLGSSVLVVVKYRDEVRVMDDILASLARLGQRMCGIIINRVPPAASDYIAEMAAPYLEKRGVPVFGVLPEQHGL